MRSNINNYGKTTIVSIIRLFVLLLSLCFFPSSLQQMNCQSYLSMLLLCRPISSIATFFCYTKATHSFRTRFFFPSTFSPSLHSLTSLPYDRWRILVPLAHLIFIFLCRDCQLYLICSLHSFKFRFNTFRILRILSKRSHRKRASKWSSNISKRPNTQSIRGMHQINHFFEFQNFLEDYFPHT